MKQHLHFHPPIVSLLLLFYTSLAFAQGNNCQNADPFCTDSGAGFPASVNNGTAQNGNNYGCLGTQPNPAWYYLQILDPGAIHISETNTSNTDVDFALWGPFPNLTNALNQCGNLNAPIDCSYSPQANEQIDIPNSSQTGNVFLLLFTNYGNSATDVIANQLNGAAGGPGSTDCSIVNNCPPVVATAAANGPLCNGSTLQLTGSLDLNPIPPGVQFVWAGPNGFTSNLLNPTIPNATSANAGTYTFYAETPNGCSSNTANVQVVIGQPTAIATSNAPLCAGQQLQLTGSTNISANVTYQWTGPNGYSSSQQNPTINNPVAGNYNLIVTALAGTCPSPPATVNVTVVSISPNINSQDPSCAGINDGAVQVNPTPNALAPFTYQWNNNAGGGTSNTVTGLGAGGPYTVLITSTSGCTATASATLTAPPPLTIGTNAQNPSCNGGNDGGALVLAAGGVGGYTYQWSGGSNPNSSTTGGLSAGTYTVTVTSGTCSSTATVALTNPPPTTASIVVTNPNCAGGTGSATAQYNGGIPSTYQWSAGTGNGSTHNNIPAGAISVTITDANGCSATATNNLVAPPLLTAAITTQNPTCASNNNGGVQATASGGTSPYTFAWNGGQTNFQVGNLGAGTYTVTITDNKGCTATANATLTAPPAIVGSITPINPTCNGGSNGSATVSASGGTGALSYAWSSGTPNGSSVTNLSVGAITVTVTDASGCTGTATANLTAPPPVTASITPTNPLCNGATSGSAVASASGGTGPNYTYTWSGGTAAGNSVTGIGAGSISVTVSDANSCTATATATLNPPTPVTASITPTNPLCNGATSGSAVASASGGTGTGYTYTWSGGTANGSSVTGIGAGSISVTVSDANSCTATATATLNPPTPVTASITPTNPLCNGATSGSAVASASGGTGAGYTYTWSGGTANGSSVTGIGAGSISVTVSDANSCTATATATLNPPTPVTASITPTNPLCNGATSGSAVASASGGTGAGYTYTWSGGTANGNSVTGIGAGSISVTVSDANSCTATATAALTEPTPVTASITPTDPLCNGATSGSAVASASGGTGAGYTYTWSGGTANGNSVTGIGAGSISVTVSDANSCTATATAALTEPTPVTASIAPTDPLCSGGANGTAVATGGGGTPTYTFAWGNAQTGDTANGLSAGSIDVVVTDANGCTASANATLNNPAPMSAAITPTDPTCSGAASGQALVAANGGTTPYTYTWSDAQTANPAINLIAGAITVTVTDANGCTATATETLTEPTPVTASIAPTNPTCNGATNGQAIAAASGGTGAYAFVWSNGQSGSNATALGIGSITVTVTDANGCTATANQILTEPVPVTASIAPTNPLCNGSSDGSATVTPANGVIPYTYAWNNGQSNQTATNLALGSFDVTVTDANGCTAIANTALTQPTAVSASITPTNVLCNGAADGSATATASGGTGTLGYIWSNGNNGTNATNLPAGAISVTVTDANGCTATATNTITEPTALQVSVTTTTSTCGQSNGTASATGNGGTGTITYLFSAGVANGSNVSGLASGSYSVTATDANGCTAVASIDISDAGAPSITVNTVTAASCQNNNGAANLTASGGQGSLTYTWTPAVAGASNGTITNVAGGTYTLVVEDTNGCQASETITIDDTTPPVIDVLSTQNATCGNNNGQVNIGVTSGGTGNFTYNWSAVAFNNQTNVTTLAAGNYTVTVTDQSSCTDVVTFSISNTLPPVISVDNTTDASCGQATGAINISVADGDGTLSYVWSDAANSTTQDVSNLTNGTYTVTVTDQSGCTDTETVSLNDLSSPNIVVNSVTDARCGLANGAITVTASGGTGTLDLLWSFNNQTTATLTNIPTGTYTVTATDDNGCTDVETINVGDSPNPDLSVAQNNAATCGNANGSVTLAVASGTGAMSYAWLPNVSAGGSQTGLSQGSYSVTVTDANSCTDTVTFTVDNLPAPTINNITPTASTCGNANGQALVDATGGTNPLSYAWSAAGVGNSATATGLLQGNYVVTVSDANNCSTTQTVTIDNVAPPTLQIAGVEDEACQQSNGSIDTNISGGTAPFSYAWSLASVGNNANAVGIAQGNYTVTVSDGNNCTATAEATVGTIAGITIDNVQITDASCGQATGGIVVNTIGTAVLYSWSAGGSVSNTAINLVAGSYQVTITDANNCQTNTTAVVADLPAPTLIISNQQNTTCNNANGSLTVMANGGAGGFSYAWSHDATLTATTANNLDALSYTITVTDVANCTATAQATLTNTAPPTLAEGIVSNANCGQSNGSASVIVNGGTAPFSYQWNDPNNQTTQTATGLAAAGYDVVVTDGNGCTANLGIAVTNLNGPVIVVDAVVPSTCGAANGSIGITASGGTGALSYLWSNGAVTEDVANLLPNDYGVTVSDAGGCVAVEVITIDDNPPPTVALTGMTEASCGQSDGSLTALAAGNATPFSYVWSDASAQNTALATNLATGNYTLTVTDNNGCTATLSATVEPAQGPTVSQSTSTAASCGQANGSATVTASGGLAPLAYSWQGNPANNSPSNNNMAAGNYLVTVTDANGCTATVDVTVPSENGPVVVVDAIVDATCGQANGSITVSTSGGVAPYAYNWSNDFNNNSINNNNLANGTYTVTATDANGCEATVTGEVLMANSPQITVDNTTNETCGLDNGAIEVSVTGGLAPYTFAWSNASSAQNQNNLSCNTYTLTVTDANGCSTNTSVTILCFDAPTVSLVANATTCGLDNGSVTATPAGGTGLISYNWNPAQPNANSINNLAAADYTVTISDANGCTATSSINVATSSAPVLTEGNIVLATCGQANGQATVITNNGTAPYSYEWNTSPAQNTATASNIASGLYGVTVTDALGCTDDLSVTVGNANGPSATTVDGAALCGTPEGSLTVTANGGSGGYTYVWSDPSSQTTAVATGLLPGVYTVTVTDSAGCSIVTDAEVVGSIPATVVSCGTVTDNSIEFVWTPVVGATGYQISVNNGTPQNVGNVTSFDVTGLAENETVTIVVIVIGAAECGNSPAANGSCTTIDLGCPPLGFTVVGLNNTYCVDNGLVPLNFTPAGGTFSGIGVSGNNFNPQTAGVGTHNITYTYSPDAECTYDTTVVVTVAPLPTPDFDNVAGVCVGEPVSFTYVGNAAQIASFSWNFGAAGTQTGVGPHTASWTTPGIQTIGLTVVDNNGCEAATSGTVMMSSVTAGISANFTDVLFGTAATLQVNAQSGSGSALTYEWSPADVNCNNPLCSNITVIPTEPTTYTVTVTDEFGCQVVADQLIRIHYENALIIPNAFSPNGDGENDIFRIRGVNITDVQLLIYNRWGQKVYDKADATNLDTGWDGTQNGQDAEIGVYVYYGTIKFIDGKEEIIKGNVSLIR